MVLRPNGNRNRTSIGEGITVKRLIVCVLGLAVLTCSSCSSNNSSANPSNNSSGGGGSTGAIAVTPSGSSAVAAGSSTTFTANVVNTSNTAVTWQVNGTVGGDATVGTISTGGSYTAPNLPPAGGSVTITAVSQADSTKSGSINLTIQFSDASVQGVYAFSFSGNAGTAAGSFQASGSGTITNGVEDYNSSTGTFSALFFTGSYSVGTDGRGSATFNSSLGTNTWRFVILASGQVRLIGFDRGDAISGTALPQASNSLSLSALAGNWSFFLSGSRGGTTIVDAGRFSLDSSGNITAGEEDQNAGGAVSSAATFTGTASSVSANGRGAATFTGTLGTSNLAFYVASANTVDFVGIDSGTFLSGSAYKQQSASFTASSLSGTYVYLLGGSDNLGRDLAEVGQVNLNGAGQVTGGVFDQNDNGTAVTNEAITGGTYSVASNGRGTVSVTSAGGISNFAVYLVSQGEAVFVEADSTSVIEGLAILQTGSAFSNSSIAGSYGLTSAGVVLGGGLDSVGRITADAGSLSTGVEDINQAGAPVSGVALSGTYLVASSGRGTAQMTGGGSTSNVVLYTISSSLAEYLQIDASEVIVGFVAQQF